MADASKRTTIYLPPEIHRALKRKAVVVDRSLSDLVTEAVRSSLAADTEDLGVFSKRSRERSVPFEAIVDRLRIRRRS
jgi:hypothetical protein